MELMLVVARPFDGHSLGDLIVEGKEISSILGSPNVGDVVPVRCLPIDNDSFEED